MSTKRSVFSTALIFSIIGIVPRVGAQTDTPLRRAFPKQSETDTLTDRWMSSMGRLAYRSLNRLTATGQSAPAALHARDAGGPGSCSPFDDDCGGGDTPTNNTSGFQSETSVAIDSTGQHVVVVYNDERGFNNSPVSISGFSYSDDGGQTFTDGGQLPVPSTGQLKSGAPLPEVFGDPDVKYVPGGNGCQFIYSSIMLQGTGAAPNFNGLMQTLCIYRSTDCGHSWAGPFEVTAASNPHGTVIRGNAADASDKELIDVDPTSGRVAISWTNFTSTALELSFAFSDDVMTADTPSWSGRLVLNSASELSFAQGSVPRFAGNGSGQLSVAWVGSGNFGSDVYVATSANLGYGFSDPVRVNHAPIISTDYILGNDRSHNFPSIAADTSPGPNQGNLYVVYESNNNGDGADIAFQRSVDGGATFSSPILLNSNPGSDRAQWYPYVTVDSTTGRVSVIYYDQGIASSGDMTELTWTYSDDAGVTWSKPSPLSPRPFHAGYGNDTSQPNLGDYVGAVAQGGTLYAAYAATPNQANFTDGQAPSPDGVAMPYPNMVFQKGVKSKLALSLGSVTFSDSGGNGYIDPGELIQFQLPLRSYASNPALAPGNLTNVSATLSTTTPGVTVTKPAVAYGTIASGATVPNPQNFTVQTSPGFVPGTKIEFSLAVSSTSGTVTLPFTQVTGTPLQTRIFAEDFESVAPGSLPSGWNSVHGAPRPPTGAAPPGYVVPWTTDSSFCGITSNGLFHVEADDGPAALSDNSRWETAISPPILVPQGAEYVTLDFDVCYDTEDDPEFSTTDYDGFFLRFVDLSPGRTARPVLAEAFADSIQTGSIAHFPKHFPQNGDPGYFPSGDMSNWGGFSNGFQHVSIRFPGMAGSIVQLLWEYTQDARATCADVRFGHSCGVIVDNIVMNSVVSAPVQPKSAAPAPAAGLKPSTPQRGGRP